MKNILVAIHYARNAENLLNQAKTLADAFGGKVWILHVTDPDPDDFRSLEAGPQFAQDKRVAERKRKAKVLEGFAQNMRNEGVEAESLVIDGPTAKTIKNKVSELNIDLVIAGHQKKNFFYQLFVGNREKDIIEELTVPILIVPLVKSRKE